MFPNIATMRCGVSCASRCLLSFAIVCLLLSPWMTALAQDAPPVSTAPPVELPAISVTVAPAARQLGRPAIQL